jgi:hypothetical protein
MSGLVWAALVLVGALAFGIVWAAVGLASKLTECDEENE